MEVIHNNNIQVYKLELEIENTGHITNTYIIKDNETAKICVIDPAFDENKIISLINEIKGELESVIVTHSHADHIAALANLAETTKAKVYVHHLDYEGLYNKIFNEEDIVRTKVIPVEKESVIQVQDKDIIELGTTKFEIMHTPGHTQGSMCIIDNKNKILYSGDTIFETTYGRTDLITGSSKDMKVSLEKLFDTFESICVLPGHGDIFDLQNSKRRIRLLYAYKG